MKNQISLMKRWMLAAAVAGLGLWAGPAFAGSEPAPAATSEKAVASEKGAEVPVEEEVVAYNNWVDVGFGYNWVNGDGAQFQQRSGIPRDSFYGGIQDLHMEGALGGGLLTLDGRAIFDNGDYLIDVRYEDPKWGYVNFGLNTYRSYYDGSAAYFPSKEYDKNNVEVDRWFDSFDDEMYIERGSLWFEGGLMLEDLPQVVFRYEHQWRHGRKDATTWGDSNLTGGYYDHETVRTFGGRGYVPSYREVEESRDIFDINITHTIGNTDFGVGGRLELMDQDNALYERRRPHEFGNVDDPNGGRQIPGLIDRRITQQEGMDAELWNVHTFTDTTFNEQFKLTSGFSYTAMDTDIDGSRIIGDHYDDAFDRYFARRQYRDEGFYNLIGGAFLKQYVGNMSLMYTPFEHLTIVTGVRVEAQDRDGVSEFIETNVGNQPNFITAEERFRNMQNRQDFEVTESLEIRYTGLEDWAFYVRGEWSEGTSQLKESEYVIEEGHDGHFEDVGESALLRDTNTDRSFQKYTAGVNWYPLHQLNIGAQYYYKEKDIDYAFLTDWEYYAQESGSTGDLYPSFIREQDFQTHDLNVRLTWRPCSFLTSVSRYDLQHSTIDTRGDAYRASEFDDSARSLTSMESAQMDSHIFSQSITIVPCSRVYLQGNGSYTFDEIETPVYGLEAPADSGYLTMVDQSRNSYWTANAVLGVQICDRTMFQAQYDYYLTDNYVNSYWASMPYGSECEESRVMATINHQLTDQILLTFRYGYMDYKDIPSGGHNSYDAHLAYAGMKFSW